MGRGMVVGGCLGRQGDGLLWNDGVVDCGEAIGSVVKSRSLLLLSC